MKLIFELSGEHQEIPEAELKSIGKIIDRRLQVAVAEVFDPTEITRLAFSHRALTWLGECIADKASFIRMLEELNLQSGSPFCGRVKKMSENRMDAPSGELERLIGAYIRGDVSVSHPKTEYRAIISEDKCYFGEVIWEIDRDPYHERKPGNRPFFHPGVMMPRMVRALVNMAYAMKGESVLDPFCGTGGTLIEASGIGCSAIGTDADREMIRGTRLNKPDALISLADARNLPFQDNSIDHVVSDLPYGQSVFIIGSALDDLYRDSLREMKRVLKPGSRSVIVTHRDIRPIAGEYFTIIQYIEQRVHRSLTRRILILRNDKQDHETGI